MKFQGAVTNTVQEGAALTTKCKLSRRGRRTRTKKKKMEEAAAMRKQAEDSAKEAKDELAMFKSEVFWRQRAREGALMRKETFSVRRSLQDLSACAVEVVLLIRNSIDKGMIDDLKAHADRVPKEVMLHDKTIKQDVLLDEKSIKEDDPHNTSVTNEPASSLHARVRQQSRGNLRGAKGEFHLTIYSLHPLRLSGEYNSAYKLDFCHHAPTRGLALPCAQALTPMTGPIRNLIDLLMPIFVNTGHTFFRFVAYMYDGDMVHTSHPLIHHPLT